MLFNDVNNKCSNKMFEANLSKLAPSVFLSYLFHTKHEGGFVSHVGILITNDTAYGYSQFVLSSKSFNPCISLHSVQCFSKHTL